MDNKLQLQKLSKPQTVLIPGSIVQAPVVNPKSKAAKRYAYTPLSASKTPSKKPKKESKG